MNIRIASPSDAEALAAIHAPIVQHRSISFELEAPPEDRMRERIVKTLQGKR